jgi:hypothetical protein
VLCIPNIQSKLDYFNECLLQNVLSNILEGQSRDTVIVQVFWRKPYPHHAELQGSTEHSLGNSSLLNQAISEALLRQIIETYVLPFIFALSARFDFKRGYIFIKLS